MNRTKQLLEKVKQAILDGRLSVENIPIEDIKYCVLNEIQVNRCTFLEEQYNQVICDFTEVCNSISENEQDLEKVLLFINAMILNVDMISQIVYRLANREYWEYKHKVIGDDVELQKIIQNIESNKRINLINYDFMKEYDLLQVKVYFNEVCSMKYVWHKGNKMYFPKCWDDERIKKYYRSVVAEQDSRSPHCYFDTTYKVCAGDVVVDAGAAEGIFALEIIDKAEQIYLIEADPEWIDALEQTFYAYSNKVHIIHGFLDSIHEGERVSLNQLFVDEDINYIKMDIEGYERSALLGADKILKNASNLRLAICSYHCKGDEEWISEFLQRNGFEVETSKGYMCPDWTAEAYLEAEIRKGIVFGNKRKSE